MMQYPGQSRRVLLLAALCGALAVAACAKKESRVYFNGKFYPTKETKQSDDRQSFKVSVRRADQGLDGAREAGRYAGTRYCLENFGTSEISWMQGPDAEDGVLTIDGGKLILTGRCVLW